MKLNKKLVLKQLGQIHFENNTFKLVVALKYHNISGFESLPLKLVYAPPILTPSSSALIITKTAFVNATKLTSNTFQSAQIR